MGLDASNLETFQTKMTFIFTYCDNNTSVFCTVAVSGGGGGGGAEGRYMFGPKAQREWSSALSPRHRLDAARRQRPKGSRIYQEMPWATHRASPAGASGFTSWQRLGNLHVLKSNNNVKTVIKCYSTFQSSTDEKYTLRE